MDFKFELRKYQASKIPKEKIIAELERIAKEYNYVDFRQDDFDRLASISSFTVYREFGSWQNALVFLQNYLKDKGIDFRITSRRSSYSDKELFDEMERIWVKFGHQPSKDEWLSSDYKISYDTYPRHFGSWKNACLKFIEYKSGHEILVEQKEPSAADSTTKNKTERKYSIEPEIRRTRTIPLSIRIKVLARDKFKCVYCGRSPAINAGTLLHIDHIVPFSLGGTNTLDNLQTLCEECNLGKSNNSL